VEEDGAAFGGLQLTAGLDDGGEHFAGVELFPVDLEITSLGQGQIAVGADLIGELTDHAGKQAADLGDFFARDAGEQFRVAHDAGGQVEEIVEEDALEDLAALFVADVGEGEDGEGLAGEEERSAGGAKVEAGAGGLGDAAFLGAAGFLLGEAERPKRAAQAAGIGLAAGVTVGPGMSAVEHFSGEQAVDLFGSRRAEHVQQRTVGEDDPPIGVENEERMRQGVEQLADSRRGLQARGLSANGFVRGLSTAIQYPGPKAG